MKLQVYVDVTPWAGPAQSPARSDLCDECFREVLVRFGEAMQMRVHPRPTDLTPKGTAQQGETDDLKTLAKRVLARASGGHASSV